MPRSIDDNSSLKVALANIDDAWLIAFLVEERRDGKLTVFVPSAPALPLPPQAMSYLMKAHQVRRRNVPVTSAVQCIMQLGLVLENFSRSHCNRRG